MGRKRARSEAGEDPAGPGADAPAAQKKGAALSALDDLFSDAGAKVKAQKAQKRAEDQEREAAARAEREKRKKRRKEEAKAKKNGGKFEVDDLTPVRIDPESGFPVYREEDLRINQGGDTADCPFDCKCCY